jgi:hypothetical protein
MKVRVDITPETAALLRVIAEKHGLVIFSGPFKGHPSLAKAIEMLAKQSQQ